MRLKRRQLEASKVVAFARFVPLGLRDAVAQLGRHDQEQCGVCATSFVLDDAGKAKVALRCGHVLCGACLAYLQAPLTELLGDGRRVNTKLCMFCSELLRRA